ncbi:MAG TPA: hypothetical protein VFC81_05905, partial [Verrucomicrobiae bacterium]|nr:hypothetical protein [Verrucomicrobiae bacterium]
NWAGPRAAAPELGRASGRRARTGPGLGPPRPNWADRPDGQNFSIIGPGSSKQEPRPVSRRLPT